MPQPRYSLVEVVMISGIATLTCLAVLALFRPQLGFEWPDLGAAEMVQSVLRRWRA